MIKIISLSERILFGVSFLYPTEQLIGLRFENFHGRRIYLGIGILTLWIVLFNTSSKEAAV